MTVRKVLLLVTATFACAEPQPEVAPPARAPVFLNINPSWSPDGASLVFESRRDSGVALYIVGADGTGERLVLRNGSQNTHPDWSPAGPRIVFDSDRGGKFNIFTIAADGSGEQQLTFSDSTSPAEYSRHPAWSPDGRFIAFDTRRDGNGEIYVMNPDGSGVRRITNTPRTESHPAWMPDGRVAFIGVGDDTTSRVLYAARLDGSAPEAVAQLPAGSGGAEISPDASTVVFFIQDGENSRLHRLSLGGGTPTPVTPEGRIGYESEWSPDGGTLAFYLGGPDDHQLYLMNADGSNVRRLVAR